MPFNLGMGELIVVLVVALLVFGGRLPQVGRSLGQGLVEFKKGLSGEPEQPDLPEPEGGPEADEPDAAPATRDPSP